VKIEMNSPLTAPPLAGNSLGTGKDSFVIAEWRDAGGPSGPPRFIAPLHLHQKDDEAWYILEGTLGVRVGDHDVEAKAGSAVFVPRGTPHTYWNAGSGLLRYLLVMPPRIYELIQEIHAMKERTPGALQTVFRKYDSELL
jgi:mannose-6-phosphate isomerase-like protein (cupin superfamily)